MSLSIVCKCGERIEAIGTSGDVSVCRCGRRHRTSAISQNQPTAAVTARETDEERFVLLTAEDELPRRLHPESFRNFVAAFARATESVLANAERAIDVHIQVACVLLPHGKRWIDLQTSPTVDSLSDVTRDRLLRELDVLPAPPVRVGPVAFVHRVLQDGGPPPQFEVPFAAEFERRGIEIDDEETLHAGGWNGSAASKRNRMWKRVFDVLRRRLRPSSLKSLSPDDTEHLEPVREVTLKHLDRFLDANPDYARGYGVRADIHKRNGDLEKAIADYSRLLELNPTDMDGFAARGNAHCLVGDRRSGLADYDTALAIDPNHVPSLSARGQVYLELAAWDQANKDFSRALRVDHFSPGLFISRSRARVALEDFDGALEDLDRAITCDPNNEEAYALRGLLNRSFNNVSRVVDDRQALDDFTAAIRLNPEQAFHHAHRAEIYLRLDDYESAIADCDAALARDVDCALALGIRGVAYQQAGHYEDAIQDCTAAIDRQLSRPQVFLSRAIAHAAVGHYDEAMSDCGDAICGEPLDAIALNCRASLLLGQDRVNEAVEDLTAAIALAPEWAAPLALRGNAYRLLGKNELAMHDLDEALLRDDELASAYLDRGLVWAEMEEIDRAMADVDRAVELDPDDALALLNRATLRVKLDAPIAALDDLDEASRVDPNFALIYLHRANLLLDLERFADAVADFDRLIAIHPTMAAAYVGRANAWIQLGETDRADTDIREAILLEPGSAEDLYLQRLLVESNYYYRLEDFDAAIAKATEAVELDDECVSAYALRAGARWYAEEHVEAVEDFDHVVRLNGESYSVLSGRGQIHAEMGEFEQALLDFDAAERFEEGEHPVEMAYTASGRALALAGLDRWEESASSFHQAVEGCPENAWCQYNQGLVYAKQGQTHAAVICFSLALQLDGPPLTPRKRNRARAFLAQHKATSE